MGTGVTKFCFQPVQKSTMNSNSMSVLSISSRVRIDCPLPFSPVAKRMLSKFVRNYYFVCLLATANNASFATMDNYK